MRWVWGGLSLASGVTSWFSCALGRLQLETVASMATIDENRNNPWDGSTMGVSSKHAMLCESTRAARVLTVHFLLPLMSANDEKKPLI